MKTTFSRYQIATAVAIFFHVVGLVGIFFFNRSFFVNATSVNLLLMLFLILYTQQKPLKHFIILFVICFCIGILVEVIGTQTGALFGEYQYGNVLGPSIQQVPIIIGVNWFIVIYCCGISIQAFYTKVSSELAKELGGPRRGISPLAIIIDGALVAVFFDWLMEPAAIKLGYWKWAGDGEVPLYNYICWVIISALLLIVFQYAQINKQNKFAVNLLLIQAMFFLLLRTFL